MDVRSRFNWLRSAQLSVDVLRPVPSLALLWFYVAGALPVTLVQLDYCGWGTAVVIGTVVLAAAWGALPTPSKRVWPMVVVGITAAVLHLWAPWSNYAALLPDGHVDAQSVEIDGVVTGDRLISDEELRTLGDVRNVTLKLRRLRATQYDEWRPCRGTVLLQNPTVYCRYGVPVVVRGMVRTPHVNGLPGSLNYRQHLKTRGIHHVVYASSIDVLANEPAGWYRIPAMFYTVREQLLKRIVRHLDPAGPGRVAAAMTLGFRQSIDAEQRARYLRSGMIHLFAISGLHVGICFSVIVLGLRLLRVPFSPSYFVAPILLLVYVVASGGAPSAVRAWLMLSLWSVGRGLKVPVNAIHATMVAALLLLLLNPLHLFQAGFQFSFVVVVALIRGWEMGQSVLATVNERQLWIPIDIQRTGRMWQSLGDRLKRALLSMAAAWFGGLGLTAYYNHLFLPAGIITNTIVCGIAWLIVVLAACKTAVSLLLPSILERGCAELLAIAISALDGVADISARYGGVMAVARPSLSVVLAYYVILFAVLFMPRNTLRRGLVVVGIVLCFWLVAIPRAAESTVAVVSAPGSVVPVVVLFPAHGQPTIINSGPPGTGYGLTQWLRSRGVSTVEHLVLLDDTRAFAGAASTLLSAFDISTLTVMSRERHRIDEIEAVAWQQGTRRRLYHRQERVQWRNIAIEHHRQHGGAYFSCAVEGVDWQLSMTFVVVARDHCTLELELNHDGGRVQRFSRVFEQSAVSTELHWL